VRKIIDLLWCVADVYEDRSTCTARALCKTLVCIDREIETRFTEEIERSRSHPTRHTRDDKIFKPAATPRSPSVHGCCTKPQRGRAAPPPCKITSLPPARLSTRPPPARSSSGSFVNPRARRGQERLSTRAAPLIRTAASRYLLFYFPPTLARPILILSLHCKPWNLIRLGP
jgi:hypothetical protein